MSDKNIAAVKEGIEHFDSKNLKHAETEVKNPLPSQDGEYREKWDRKLSAGVWRAEAENHLPVSRELRQRATD